jgi:hypothetical protein
MVRQSYIIVTQITRVGLSTTAHITDKEKMAQGAGAAEMSQHTQSLCVCSIDGLEDDGS